MKESTAEDIPFRRLKIRLKKELISLGRPANAMGQVGEYVEPEEWNELIERDDVLLLDTRND